MTRLLNKREAAEYLNISPRTLDYFRERGGLPSHVIGSKLVRFDARELEQWATGRSSGKDSDEQAKEEGNEEN